MKSIKTRLILWFLSISLLPIFLNGFTIYSIATEEMVNKQTESYVTLSGELADSIDAWLAKKTDELKIIAKTNDVINNDVSSRTKLFLDVKNSSESYESVIFTAPDGIVRAHTDKKQVNKLNLGKRDYFKEAMKGNTNISEILKSNTTGNRVIAIATPVYKEKEIIGVLSASVNFDSLVNELTKDLVIANGKGSLLLIDDTKKIQASPDKASIGLEVEKANIPEVLKGILTQKYEKEGFDTYEDKGEEFLLIHNKISSKDFIVFIQVPMSEVVTVTDEIVTASSIAFISIMIVVTVIAILVANQFSNPIKKIVESAKKVSDGDLTVEKLNSKRKDEIGSLSNAIDNMVDNLRKLVSKINITVDQVASSSAQLNSSAEETTKATMHISNSIHEISTGAEGQSKDIIQTLNSMEKVNQNIHSITDTIQLVSINASDTNHSASLGVDSMNTIKNQMDLVSKTIVQLGNVIKKLGETTKEIEVITDVINNISSQTNLLALNAAIEAARAGEHGRGFAVVADEVRKLAEESASSTKEINALISSIQAETSAVMEYMDEGSKEVARGIEMVGDTEVTFIEIQKSITAVTNEITEVLAAIQEISSSSTAATRYVNDISDISKENSAQSQSVLASTEETLASMEEITQSSRVLSETAEQLQNIIKLFKV